MATKALADYTSSLTYDSLSAHSIDLAKQCILDWLGVTISGSQEPSARIIRNVILKSVAREATVFSEDNIQASVYDAAFCNSSASQPLDFDDVYAPATIHCSAVVIPSVFAIGEYEHKSGKEMITAICAGYEAGARIGEFVNPESYFFWHTTGTVGTMAAGAAAANLLHLDKEKTLMCYGTAGTQAAGFWEFLQDGAMSKLLHAGKSAYAGVLSAYLSQAGFTGARKILEGSKGFGRSMLKEPHFDKLSDGLGNGLFKIESNTFKPYACCKHTHAAVYAVQLLIKENGLRMRDIDKIELHVNSITNRLCNNPSPENANACKFSVQYCVAVVLKDGKIGNEQFASGKITDKEIRDFLPCIQVILDSEMERIHQESSNKLAAKAVIKLRNKQVLEQQVDFPKGDPENPFSWQETKNKYEYLSIPVFGESKVNKLYSLIENLEKCKDFSEDINQCFL